jgi:hypothetical protein
MWTRLLLLCCAAIRVRAQQDPMELLRRVQRNVSESLDRVPRYMCTETIDRSQFEPDFPARGNCDNGDKSRTHLTTSDRLRLDVGMAATVEIYSWVGESKFNDHDLFQIVREGAISSGAFAAFLTAIFRSSDASFTYDGEKGGLSAFGFQIPYEKSHYYYGEGAHRIITGYDGTFLVDPKTASLTHLDVHTSQLPSETGACHASTSLDYSQVRMKGVDFLLPSASQLTIARVDGGKAENRTVFSSCHEFLGESTISFDGPSKNAPSAAESSTEEPLAFPAGLRFEVVSTQAIDPGTAAAGDPVKAKLLTPIKHGSYVLVPAGAAVNGRIVRIRQFYGQNARLVVELKLEAVSVKGAWVPFRTSPDVGSTFNADSGRTGLQKRVALGTLIGLEESSASFTFRGGRVRPIAPGLESSWVTSK